MLEIGSGLGYLTYSLNQLGIETLGIDISEPAIEKVECRFGEHYQKEDVFNSQLQPVYDFVVKENVAKPGNAE